MSALGSMEPESTPGTGAPIPTPDALGNFNAGQRAAIEHGEGPVCIIAGPGSGKTRTLTTRIAYLLQQKHVAPEQILALTFTNKAAHEMRERTAQLIGAKQTLPVICTFHALSHALLPDETPLADEATRLEIIREIIKTRKLKGRSVRDLALEISKAKNIPDPDTLPDQSTRNLVAAYNAALASRGLHDFDDLLLHLHAALKQNSLSKRPAYRYILVDEFQDTNELQYQILCELDTTANVLVIGDPMQSIYGFRGASAAIFDRFVKDWPHTRQIVLDVNYRSAPEIVRVAGALFPEGQPLKPHRQTPGKVQLVETLNEYGEADWVVNEIERQIGGSTMIRGSQHHGADTGRDFRHFAILYRTHTVARNMQKALSSSGIPFQVAGEGSPYFDDAVQAVIQALNYLDGRIELSKLKLKGLTLNQCETLLDPLLSEVTTTPLTTTVGRIMEKLSLSYDQHEKLRPFVNAMLPFDNKPLAMYLDHVASLAEQAYYDPAAEAVTLLTIHAAKGLEFSCIFLLAAEEGTLPHFPRYSRSHKTASGSAAKSQNIPTAQHIAEEKRLFYVAVTRARDELYLLHARTRHKEPQTVSSFISALPKGLVDQITDPLLEDQQQRARRKALKRAQGSLF